MFCEECGGYAASKAIRELTESGQVGRTEIVTIPVLAEATLTESPEAPDVTMYILQDAGFILEEGKTYTVHLDSGSYKAVCKILDGVGLILGNAALAGGGDDTGESFVVGNMGFNGTMGLVVMDRNCGTKASITTETETIHPIDPKYLVKEINLDSYGASYEKSIGHALATQMFAIISGETVSPVSIPDVGTFWEDLNTKNPLDLVCTFVDYTIHVTGQTICYNSVGDVLQISGTLMNFLNGKMYAASIVIVLERSGEEIGALVYVISRDAT